MSRKSDPLPTRYRKVVLTVSNNIPDFEGKPWLAPQMLLWKRCEIEHIDSEFRLLVEWRPPYDNRSITIEAAQLTATVIWEG